MLSVAKLTLGQEAYYEQQVAGGLDDYYAARGESPGIWAGQGAAALELSGVVEDGDLGTLLRGRRTRRPRSRFATPVRERTITVRTLDVETGGWREERKAPAPVSGYDLVFSCPKSVSLLHALTDDERSAAGDHRRRTRPPGRHALGYLEREACVVRRGKGGSAASTAQGFVAAAFRHRTSRAQEPHLHTHVIVANMTRADDGTWRALDGEAILQTLPARRRLPVRGAAPARARAASRSDVDGTGEGHGRARAACRRRRPAPSPVAVSRCVEHMEALGTEGFAAARVAALATREAEGAGRPAAPARGVAGTRGRARARSAGAQAPRSRPPAVGRSNDRPRWQLAERLLGPDGLTARQTDVRDAGTGAAVAGSLRDGASVERVVEEAEALSRLPGLEHLEQDAAPGRPARFTTRELLADRARRDRARARRQGGRRSAPRTERSSRSLIMASGRGLTDDQRMLVHGVSCRPDRVVCVVGAAGAGKTTALRVLGEAYRESEMPVLGAAPSGRAADELRPRPAS